jgi:hypothetical protein
MPRCASARDVVTGEARAGPLPLTLGGLIALAAVDRHAEVRIGAGRGTREARKKILPLPLAELPS